MTIVPRLLLLLGIALSQSALANTESELIQLLRGGNHFAMMRHALAPGTGDPAVFDLRQCSTQRNLNDLGRSQSVFTGDFFRSNNIEFTTIYSSQWCRCLETARLLGLGSVEELPVLNSFFQSMHEADVRTRQLREWLANETSNLPLLLVTHQVNISALTGQFASSGEIIVVELTKENEIIVKGSFAPR